MNSVLFDIWNNGAPVIVPSTDGQFNIWENGAPIVDQDDFVSGDIGLVLAAGDSTAFFALGGFGGFVVSAAGDSSATIVLAGISNLTVNAAGDSSMVVNLIGEGNLQVQLDGDSSMVAAFGLVIFFSVTAQADSSMTVTMTGGPKKSRPNLFFGY